MLSKQEQQRLTAISAAVTRADPRFAHALERGRPCGPREFRRRRVRLVIAMVALLVLPLCGWLIVRGDPAALLLAWPAILIAVWGLRGLPRPPDRLP